MNLKKKRKSKQRIPTVATSATWQEFYRAKERAKILREAEVEKRKKQRLEMAENKKRVREEAKIKKAEKKAEKEAKTKANKIKAKSTRIPVTKNKK